MHMQWWKYVNSIEYCYYLCLIYECEILLAIKWTKQLSDKIKKKKTITKHTNPIWVRKFVLINWNSIVYEKNKRNFSCWWVTILFSKYRFILFVRFEWDVFVKYLDHLIYFFHFELINIDKTLLFFCGQYWMKSETGKNDRTNIFYLLIYKESLYLVMKRK